MNIAKAGLTSTLYRAVFRPKHNTTKNKRENQKFARENFCSLIWNLTDLISPATSVWGSNQIDTASRREHHHNQHQHHPPWHGSPNPVLYLTPCGGPHPRSVSSRAKRLSRTGSSLGEGRLLRSAWVMAHDISVKAQPVCRHSAWWQLQGRSPHIPNP